MLSLLKHKLHSFGGYRISMDEGSGGTPGADPLVGQAAMKSADLADRVYADNKALVEELKPIIRDNAALQTSAAKDAYGQSKINLTDYNTLGRPAIKQQAIGHGLARYVDDATANSLYDLYATRDGLANAPDANPPSSVSFVGADGAGMSVSPDAALKSVNYWRGTKNKAAATNAQAQIDALKKAGYELTQDANGNYSFSSMPQTRMTTATAENDKAIWNAERGLENTAIDTESARAADAAGTDVTQAISSNNQMLERQARGMVGFNPNKFARTMASNGIALGNASLRAGGINAARENARRGVVAASDAGTANTINTTRGLPSQAMNWANTGQNQGNGAVGNGVTGITANNVAVAPALQGWGQVGQLGMAKYNAEMNAYNTNQNSDGGAGMVVGLASAAATAY